MPASATPFEALQDMAYVLNHFDVSIDPLVIVAPSSGKSDSRYRKGYQLLQEKKCEDEANFAQTLGFPDPKDKGYRRYRGELIHRMQQVHLFVGIGIGDEQDYFRNYLDIVRLWAITRTLRTNGAFQAFLYSATECLELAEKYEIPHVAIEVLFSLTSSALSRPELSKDFLIWKEALIKNKGAYDAIFSVTLSRESFMVACVGKKGYQKETSILAERALDAVKDSLNHYSHFSVQFHGRMLQVAKHEILHEWTEMSQVASDALDFFSKKPYSISIVMGSFSIYLIIASAMAGDHQKAMEAGHQYLSYSKDGSFYWFKNREIVCFSSFYSGNYHEAYQIIQLVTRHERFKYLSSIDQETWRLYQGYLLWLHRSGKLPLSEAEQKEMARLRLSTLLNDMPIYAKDKQGGNIPLAILQALFLLSEGRWDEFELRADALRKYRERNLSIGEDVTRSDIFIKIILNISKHYNAPAELKNKVAPLLLELKEPQTPMLGPSFEVEPLRYEVIWGLLSEQLGCE